MEVSTTIETGSATGADTVAVALFEDGAVPADTPPAVAELVASGEARSSIRALALAHGDGKRWLIVGLGAREQLTPERARSAAAGAHGRALEISTKTLCWQVPDGFGPEVAAAITEGTVLADYRFERFRSPPSAGADGEPAAPKHLDALIVSTPADNAGAVADAAVVARAVNSARELQNRPGNDLTPTALAQYASDLAEQVAHLTVKTEGRAGPAEWVLLRLSPRDLSRSRR
jgi:leucyl aminopeptidase